jgi:hypothetical protein
MASPASFLAPVVASLLGCSLDLTIPGVPGEAGRVWSARISSSCEPQEFVTGGGGTTTSGISISQPTNPLDGQRSNGWLLTFSPSAQDVKETLAVCMTGPAAGLVYRQASGPGHLVTADCPTARPIAIGGGCRCAASTLTKMGPVGLSSWHCSCTGGGELSPNYAYAICLDEAAGNALDVHDGTSGECLAGETALSGGCDDDSGSTVSKPSSDLKRWVCDAAATRNVRCAKLF